MRRHPTFWPCLAALCLLALSFPLRAESKFSGDFLFGYRMVETSGPGADFRYREDFNLQSGPRLTSFNLSFAPDNGFRKYFDRLDLRAANFGGDPFETFDLRLQKYGRYKMQFQRKKSSFFYHDLNPGDGGVFYDLHSFNFDRVADSGLAKIFLGKQADLTLNFDRTSKTGKSTTTQDINRVDFELRRPIDEGSKEIAAGLNVHFDRMSLVLEERYLNTKNENSLFLPGYADGGPYAEYPSSLNDYFLDQPYEIKSKRHLFKFTARPTDRLLLSGSARIFQDNMDLDYREMASGINYLNRLFYYRYTGKGNFDRNMVLYDFDLSFAVTHRLSFVGAVRYHQFDQNGSLTVDDESETVDFGYDTLYFEGGLQYLISPKLGLTLGCRNENRNLDNLETATHEFKTQRNLFFGNLKWDFQALKLTLDYEHNNDTDPFTLISPKDFDRLRATARYRLGNFNLIGSYFLAKTHGEVFEQAYDSRRNQVSLRAGYHVEKLQAFAGYSLIGVKHEADREVEYPPYWTGPGGSFLWEIFYEGKASLLDASLAYEINNSWKLGGYANYYANTGSWEIGRTMIKAYVEYSFPEGYLAQVGYRFVDYREKIFGSNDYKASILELSFGYRWN